MRSSRRSDRSRNLLTTPQGQDTRSESRGRRRPRLFTSTHPDTFHQRVKCWEKVRSESPFLKKKNEIEIYQRRSGRHALGRSRNLLTTPQGQDTRSESRGRRRPRLFTSTHPDTFHQRVK